MYTIFQSTLPVWGATISRFKQEEPRYFNPRSPCGERLVLIALSNASINFNPRSPCGERLGAQLAYFSGKQFQSTLPVWGATRLLG